MKAVFKIGGKDFTRLVPSRGIKWSRNDLDANGTGRALNTGNMRRRRVAVKRKLAVTCRRMNENDIKELNEALYPQFISVTFLDPIDGISTRTFYGSTVEATTQVTINGETYWEGTAFSLVER